ncbi:MAG: ribonuclease H-like domain-containing protein, partial [Anaplasmataceae bacterium]|nr:ribonuclease H-like domain-containing protein [Anaplasmataceae bacterium]
MQKYSNKSIIVFDIETIPDTDIAESLTGKHSQTEEEKREDIYNYHLDTTSNSFPRQPFHKIITCSVLQADFTDQGIKISYLGACGIDEYNEKDIVSKFFNLFENQNKQRWLVSFNGRTFDLPVLKYRAMLYHIECAGHYKTDYYYRYSWQNHCDLLEHLS